VRDGVNGSDAVFLFLLGFSFTFRRALLPFFYLLSGTPVFLLSLVGGGNVACTRRIHLDPQGTIMTARRSVGFSRVDRCCAGVWIWITSGSGYLNNVK
jgi:hypothetical protein